MAYFQNCLFSRSNICVCFVFFNGVFAQNNCNFLVEKFFSHVFGILKFLMETDHFAKAIALAWAIAFARWLIFKIISFLAYLGFFVADFAKKDFNVLVEWFFTCFWHFKFNF